MNQNHDHRNELKEVSLKATPARMAILDFLEKEHRPIDVSELLAYLSVNNISMDQVTVYRILDKFYKSNIVKRLEFGEGKFRYEITHVDDHHHLICESCGKIEDISDCGVSVLEKEIAQKKKFLVKRHSLEFFGLCSDCQK
jgi:Fur family ferric uptake transcriptional regulator